jgi:hypothetical protein
MQTLANTDWSPSETWNQFLHNLSWKQDTKINSAYKAFKEAIRRGISRSDVFFDVAETIDRASPAVNWGMLRWRWKQALQDSNRDRASRTPAPTLKTPPPPPSSFQRSLPLVNGKGDADHHFQHNGTEPHNGNGHHNGHIGAKYQQRRPASLVSYYE